MWTISPYLLHFMKFLFKFLFPSSLKSELLQIFLFTLKCIQKNWFLQFAHFYCHFYSNKTETRWLRQCRVVSYNQSENHSDHSLQLFFFLIYLFIRNCFVSNISLSYCFLKLLPHPMFQGKKQHQSCQISNKLLWIRLNIKVTAPVTHIYMCLLAKWLKK